MGLQIFVSVDSERLWGGVEQDVTPKAASEGMPRPLLRVFGPFSSWAEGEEWARVDVGLAPEEYITFEARDPEDVETEREFEVEVETTITVTVEARNDLEAEDKAFDAIEGQLVCTNLADWNLQYADVRDI